MHLRLLKLLTLLTTVIGTAGLAFAEKPADVPVKVFLLAGQSNMQGQGVVDMDHPQYYNGGKGILNNVMKGPKNAARYGHIKDANGNYVVRDDVWVRYQTKHELKRRGLGIGLAGYEGLHHIGPEFQFGHVIGDQFKEPVLLIKTAWGGKSLYQDFRPPSAGGEVGPYYTQMIKEADEALAAMGEDFPSLKGRKYELAGFVWFQGWNDMFNKDGLAEYEENLVHLVNDVRKHFDTPKLPVIIGELGNGGPKANENMLTIRQAQKQAAKSFGTRGNVVFVQTSQFARPAEESPNVGHGHHWFGNAESYFLIGDALGKAMIKLVDRGN
ncbi:MAG: sialate O-acetylesterase [Blastopirellula sp.]|nr:MAG: sialate O-acetylesterase [Blastopirellula sp.]